MSEFYTAFNEAYKDFVLSLRDSFNDIQALHIECQLVSRALELDGPASKRIFNWTKEGLIPLATNINAKNAIILKRENNKHRVALFERAQIYAIVPRLVDNELDMLWKGLKGLTQHISLLEGTAGHLDQFQEMARTFIEQNPNASESNMQSLIYEQMFTNKAMSEQMRNLMTTGDLNNIRSGMGTVLRGLGVDNAGSQFEQKMAPKPVITPCEATVLHDTSPTTSTSAEQQEEDDASVNQLFQSLSTQSNDIAQQASEVKEKPAMAQMMEFLDSHEMKPEDLNDVRELTNSVLGHTANAEDTQKVKNLFGMITKGSQSPEDIASAIQGTCKTTPEQMDSVKNIAAQFANFGSLNLQSLFNGNK